MLVLLIVAGLAVIGCVVAVSLGHGGELAVFPPDEPTLDLPGADRLTAADVAALRLPTSLVGYQTNHVDETLRRVAVALRERDERIALLERRVADLLAERSRNRPRVFSAPGGVPQQAGEPAAERWSDDRADAEESW